MDKDEIKQIMKEVLSVFKKEMDESISKTTIERNAHLIEAVKSDHSEINLETLIRDYLNVGDLGDISVNYSFIQNRRLKKQLTIDNLQMEKYRLGLVNGEPNFIGFCKYAHFQIEGLISYYIYIKVNGDFEKFQRRFPKVNLYKSKSFSELTHYQKSTAASTELNIDVKKDYGSIRQNVSNVRNQYSHRTYQSIVDEYLDKFPLGEYPKDLPEDSDEKKKFIKTYYIQKFIATENYSNVRNAIKDLATLIKSDLTQ